MSGAAAGRLPPWACTVEDVADLVSFLACAESRCRTGQTLVLGSGTLAHRPQHAVQHWRERQ
ncbi:hypothetical protein [Nonomuraea fuscirosea]|uniref:hypothetical protein n=1 Tax=Nonomuraea fuscirosea TaxID=1291556 RepID=UPI00343D345E